MDGCVTKDDFEKALRAHKEVTDGMKSDQRETARKVYNQGMNTGCADFHQD